MSSVLAPLTVASRRETQLEIRFKHVDHSRDPNNLQAAKTNKPSSHLLSHREQIENPSAYYRALFGIYGDVEEKPTPKRLTNWVGLSRLFVNEDSYGMLCGRYPERTFTRYLYHLNYGGCNRTLFRCDFQICAEICPYFFWDTRLEEDLMPLRHFLFCAPDVDL
ncbi:unnamed protein product, partial [Notodromas monacha]